MGIFEPVIETLSRAGVRYVVVGGFAVVLHGHARLTADLDLAVDLSPNEARKAVDTLMGMGLRPRAPVDAAELADVAARERWRPQDQTDIAALQAILERKADGTTEEDRPPAEDPGWVAHEREQLTLGLAATPAGRLAWLEEMITLAHRTGALPREPDPPTS